FTRVVSYSCDVSPLFNLFYSSCCKTGNEILADCRLLGGTALNSPVAELDSLLARFSLEVEHGILASDDLHSCSGEPPSEERDGSSVSLSLAVAVRPPLIVRGRNSVDPQFLRLRTLALELLRGHICKKLVEIIVLHLRQTSLALAL
ncbi:hypothetical protein PFISCL1PPCAC_21426, partial [Pristionchus fissidentatus]